MAEMMRANDTDLPWSGREVDWSDTEKCAGLATLGLGPRTIAIELRCTERMRCVS